MLFISEKGKQGYMHSAEKASVSVAGMLEGRAPQVLGSNKHLHDVI